MVLVPLVVGEKLSMLHSQIGSPGEHEGIVPIVMRAAVGGSEQDH